ncbi:WD domain, g-beta repeat domain-containing protein [Ditylenchus destructor]|uniref:WD domain, g-beta repeat domain-containing protein n=1 Tax=Ditylenchus destructor TaxID=166010 RepID=A0AAD4N285_9BILA|nr:WD domain, g-beta repeat domain-containing protein [Ditylenchus destructor]
MFKSGKAALAAASAAKEQPSQLKTSLKSKNATPPAASPKSRSIADEAIPSTNKHEVQAASQPHTSPATQLIDRTEKSSYFEAVSTNSRTLFVIFPTLEEFVTEREVLRTSVLPELQQYCSDRDIDLEVCTIFETPDLVENVEYHALVAEYLSCPSRKQTTTALCFVGDKYGRAMLPTELRVEEFNAIQSAALEISNDVKLLDQYYVLDKTYDECADSYRLRPATGKDPNSVKRLCETLQKSIKRAYDDGVIHQIHEQRQEQFFKSLIELVVDEMLTNADKNLFVTRRFQGYQSQGPNDRWVDASGSDYEKVSNLKNRISERCTKTKQGLTNHLPFIFNLHSTNPTAWAKSKEAVTYERTLALQICDALKQLLGIPHVTIPALPIPPIRPMEVVEKEHAAHINYLEMVCPRRWSPRPPLDTKLSEVVEKGMRGSTHVHIHGLTGSGKTALLCQLFKMLQQKADQCFVIARFTTLSASSVFANELLQSIFLKAHALAGIDPIAMGACFHLSEILAQAKIFAEKLSRPLFIIIDDVHLMKLGRVLSRVEKKLKELLPNISLIMFSTTAASLSCFGKPSEVIEVPPPSLDLMMDVAKGWSAQQGRKLGSDQISLLRSQLKKSNGNLILCEIITNELLLVQTAVSADVDARFALIEVRCGMESVRTVCQLLCCSPFGISTLELIDGFRLRTRQAGMAFEPEDVLSAAPLLVFRQLGCLIQNVCLDGRRLWIFRHSSTGHAVRQRYLQSSGEIKLMNEVMATIMTYPINPEEDQNEVIASSLLFPQSINKDNGAVNLRRVRFHWYYLLFTGNIENLKRLTLCSFDYLEATFRGCGLAHLLSIFEECLQQILDHDLLVIFEQVLLPSIDTLIRDERQFVSEFLNRLRYTRARNSGHLNHFVEQAMQWTDNYAEGPLLVPLTCWISPPKLKQVASFTIPCQWKSTKTIIQPTHNHQHLLVAGNDLAASSIYMYHIASQLLVKTFTGHQARVSSFCASHDGQFFVSTDLGGSIKIWNFTQAECIKTLRASPAKILCSLISADDSFIVVGSADSTAYVINIESGEVVRAFGEHTGPVVGLQLSSDSDLLVTGSGDFVVMVWDIELGKIIAKMSGLMAPVTCLAITSNDAFLAVACEDETLRIFSMVSSQELHELSGHDSRVNALVASADDCQLFAATKGKVLVFDIHNGQLLEVLALESGSASMPVTSLKISDDNSFVLASCSDRIHMWNVNSIEREALQNDHSVLSCVKMSPDEKGAGCGTVDGILAFWDLDVCQCLWTTTQQKSGAITALEFTFDSLYLLSGSAQGSVSLWEASNGQLLKQFQIHNGDVTGIVCFGDGIRVLSCCEKSGKAQIWNLVHLDDPGQVEVVANIENLKAPLFVRLNDSVIVGQNAKNLKELNIWSITPENRLSTKSKAHHNAEIVCYNVNKTGGWLVTGSLDLSLKVWQTESGFLTQVLVGHDDRITCCCISDDGSTVVSGGKDKRVIVWDVRTGTIRRSISTNEPLCGVDISQDGSVIVSADQSGWLEARDAQTGQMLSSFNAHRSIDQLIMSVDGNRILCKLAKTAQLPIICLHNTPANLATSLRHTSDRGGLKSVVSHHRLQSATSFSSTNNASEDLTQKDGTSLKPSASNNLNNGQEKQEKSEPNLRKNSKGAAESSSDNQPKVMSNGGNSGSIINSTILSSGSGASAGNNQIVQRNKLGSQRKSSMCLIL